MNKEEARFILRAYRSDGREATEPLFKEALEQARHDPAMKAWLAHEHALDRTVAAKLDAIQPPAGLRDAILIGARASRPRPQWWRSPVMLAVAAAVVAAVALPVVFKAPETAPAVVASSFGSMTEFARFGMDNIRNGPHGHPTDAGASAIEAALAESTGSVRVGFDLSAETFRRAGCQYFKVGSRDVYEVCFNRNGTWFHLFVTRRGDLAAGTATAGRDPEFHDGDGVASAAWADAGHFYTLVTRAGAQALRELI